MTPFRVPTNDEISGLVFANGASLTQPRVVLPPHCSDVVVGNSVKDSSQQQGSQYIQQEQLLQQLMKQEQQWQQQPQVPQQYSEADQQKQLPPTLQPSWQFCQPQQEQLPPPTQFHASWLQPQQQLLQSSWQQDAQAAQQQQQLQQQQDVYQQILLQQHQQQQHQQLQQQQQRQDEFQQLLLQQQQFHIQQSYLQNTVPASESINGSSPPPPSQTLCTSDSVEAPRVSDAQETVAGPRTRKSKSRSQKRSKSCKRSKSRKRSRSRKRCNSSRSRSRRRSRSHRRRSPSRRRSRSRPRDKRKSRSRGRVEGKVADDKPQVQAVEQTKWSGNTWGQSSGTWQNSGTVANAWAPQEPLASIAVNWAQVPRTVFQRAFLDPKAAVNTIDAAASRALLGMEIESGPPCLPPIQEFAELNLLPSWLKSALVDNKWHAPMPIQAQALPILMSGHNFIGIAQTGSGKTIAFLLPAVVHALAQRPLTRQEPGPIVLVMSPTRELAVQISDEATKLLTYSTQCHQFHGGMRSACFYGGGKKSEQLRNFSIEGTHIVVATPGRLMDFCKEKRVSLARVTYLVLDEADRMLELGFKGDIDEISGAIRPERQMVFFSATWPKEVEICAANLCSDAPVMLRVSRNKNSTASAGGLEDGAEGLEVSDRITQEVVVIDFPNESKPWAKQEETKNQLLEAHIKRVLADANAKMLVFVNQKNFADELSDKLWKEGFHADTLHGGRPQETRLRVLDEFRKGTVRLLIATDVMGRGLDIPAVTHVVVYSISGIDDYIHRIGRTGRGKEARGHALVFFEFSPKQPEMARDLLAVLEKGKQVVPPQLREIAAEVAAGKRGWPQESGFGGGWKKSSWSSNQGTEGWKKGGDWSSTDAPPPPPPTTLVDAGITGAQIARTQYTPWDGGGTVL